MRSNHAMTRPGTTLDLQEASADSDMNLAYRWATPADAPECVRLRGVTRENAVSESRLASLGITVESWAKDIESGELAGFVCLSDGELAGYCFGSSSSGEVVVLALQAAYENRGIGRQLLAKVVDHLHQLGHTKLFLGCSSDPEVRSYGFYRHLGWKSTGKLDRHGDEILELISA